MMIASYTCKYDVRCIFVQCLPKMGTNKQTDGKLNSRSRIANDKNYDYSSQDWQCPATSGSSAGLGHLQAAGRSDVC